MKQPVKMPTLSDTMESGRLLRWLKQPGDAVKKGDAVAEVETDKAVMEMEAFHSGTLIGPLAEEDKEYPVGETLAWIGDEQSGEAEAKKGHAPARQDDKAVGEHKAAEEPQQPAADETQTARPIDPRTTEKKAAHHAEPAAAEAETKTEKTGTREPETGTQTARTGKGAAHGAASAVLEQALAGRSARPRREEADAGAALRKEIESGPPYRIEPALHLRQVIAVTVSHAAQTPQFRISMLLDLGAFKASADEHDGSFTLLLAKACAMTLNSFPDFNAAWTQEGLARRERVDVAIAMEAENGLLTPVVRDVAGRSLSDLAEAWNVLKQKISQHRTAPEDFRGATFYLSNLGMFPGIVQFDAIVPPGATAILAVASPGEKGTMLTLTCDHRVVFGADAARFLAALAEKLTHPDFGPA